MEEGVADPSKFMVAWRKELYTDSIDRAPQPWDPGEWDSLPCCSLGNAEILHFPLLAQAQETLLTNILPSDLVQSLQNKDFSDENCSQKNLQWKEVYLVFRVCSNIFFFFSADHVMPTTLDSLRVINALQRPWNLSLIYGYFSLCFFLPHYKPDLN